MAEKATLPVDVGLAQVPAKQYALIIENIPVKVWESRRAAQAFLAREVGRRLNDQFDAAVVNVVEAGGPPSFTATSNLVADIRHALAEMVDRGGSPRYIALDPLTAADLDLSEDSSGRLIFRVDRESSSSPIWSLLVRTVPTIAAPTLIDPEAFQIYTGQASALLDPFGANLTTNRLSLRIEYEAAAHRRSLVTGATVIS